jgi:AraC-like DNA-binding protein
LLRRHFEELRAESRSSLSVRRARAVRVVSDALEAIEHAGLGSAAAWDAFPEFIAAVRMARKDADLLDAAMQVLGIVKRHAVDAAPNAASGYERLNALLTERLGERVTIEEAAATLGVSASALSHDLRRKFKMNFSEYVGRLRVEAAKDLLGRTQLSATEIARRVGVADQSHFGKLFRKFAGMTPIAYRERFGRK